MSDTRPVRSDGGWASRALAGGSLKAIAYYATSTYVLPIGLPLLTGYLARAREVPWDLVLLTGGAMFAAVSHGVLRFDEWLDRRRVKDRLGVVRPRININAFGPGIGLGLELSSLAAVPIEFEVVEIRTRLNNRVPPTTPINPRRFTVPPRGVGWFTDHVIDFGEPPKGGALVGYVEMKIKYGRPGNLRYELNTHKQVVVAFDSDGRYASASGTDASL